MTSQQLPGPKHLTAMLTALFVTVLWSSSWVLVKIGLQSMPPLTFAGLRYVLGFLLLACFVRKSEWQTLRRLDRGHWWELLGLGVCMYALTQGTQFLSLRYFPAVLPAMILYMTPVLIAVSSGPLLGERPRPHHLVGIAICVLGIAVYFRPRVASGIGWTPLLLIPLAGLLSNTAAAILGRRANRRQELTAKLITVVSMGVGAVLLLLVGLATEPFPAMELVHWEIVIWLAAVNTAFAFTLWNQTLRTLSSVESSVINNTMMVQIALLAWYFLGEQLGATEIVAIILVLTGIIVVQLGPLVRREPI